MLQGVHVAAVMAGSVCQPRGSALITDEARAPCYGEQPQLRIAACPFELKLNGKKINSFEGSG